MTPKRPLPAIKRAGQRQTPIGRKPGQKIARPKPGYGARRPSSGR